MFTAFDIKRSAATMFRCFDFDCSAAGPFQRTLPLGGEVVPCRLQVTPAFCHRPGSAGAGDPS